MKIRSAVLAAALAAPVAVSYAADPPKPPPQGLSGSGELGLAASSGNTHTQNVNAKVVVKYNDDRWKNEAYLSALRSQNDVKVTVTDTSTDPPTQVSSTKFKLTANRYEGGASAGYKLDDRSYAVGAVRVEHDEFSPFKQQSIATLGYGYQVLKNPRDELAFEVGAGYKSTEPTAASAASNPLHVSAASQNGAAARGKFEFKHSFNATTSLSNTALVESSSGNTFVQNDTGLQVKMTDKIGLKAAYEVRYNSDVLPGFKSTDQLLTTNLVYAF